MEHCLTMAEQLVEQDIHILAIQDMAGLLKPEGASMLFGAPGLNPGALEWTEPDWFALHVPDKACGSLIIILYFCNEVCCFLEVLRRHKALCLSVQCPQKFSCC